jgi:hypothetical protein
MHLQDGSVKSSADMLARFARSCMLGEADPVRHMKIMGVQRCDTRRNACLCEYSAPHTMR